MKFEPDRSHVSSSIALTAILSCAAFKKGEIMKGKNRASLVDRSFQLSVINDYGFILMTSSTLVR